MGRIIELAFVLAATACSNPPVEPGPTVPTQPAAAPPDRFDQALARLSGLRERMCACADQPCADRVGDEHKEWVRENSKQFYEGDAASDAQVGRTFRLERAFATCRKKFRSSGAGEAMKKMIEFKDKMCRCSDKACADKVTDEMVRWSQEMAKNADKDTKVSDEDLKTMQVVTEEFTKCATRAMTSP